MAGEEQDEKDRKSTRFDFVSRVRYVLRQGQIGEAHEGLMSNVSIGGLSLTVNQPLTAEQEILITECILPYCRKAYKVLWCKEAGPGAYRAGLADTDDNAAGAGKE